MLYESTRQPQDALACYNNAKGANSPHLHQRIKYLKAQLSNLPPPPPPPMQTGPGMKPKQLPSVEEAWNVPISNEMTSRHPAPGATAAGASGEFEDFLTARNRTHHYRCIFLTINFWKETKFQFLSLFLRKTFVSPI